MGSQECNYFFPEERRDWYAAIAHICVLSALGASCAPLGTSRHAHEEIASSCSTTSAVIAMKKTNQCTSKGCSLWPACAVPRTVSPLYPSNRAAVARTSVLHNHAVTATTAVCYNFYPGVWYASCQSGVEKAAYFYGYGWLKALALRGGGGELRTATDLGLGYLAEAFHLPLTIPIEVTLAWGMLLWGNMYPPFVSNVACLRSLVTTKR